MVGHKIQLAARRPMDMVVALDLSSVGLQGMLMGARRIVHL